MKTRERTKQFTLIYISIYFTSICHDYVCVCWGAGWSVNKHIRLQEPCYTVVYEQTQG